ncbi:acyltransferase [Acinetobacter sp. ESL0695]|uniref:Acyltransferase n=1 Tax=Acinetobacter pollinis TaxID=2605270 RepID=A0ABU6DSF2_9GAMM|nr:MULTISPECIES: acyltransferase [Acinetobacter]MEB5476363.1 acyltransferase [Acinetobacter pollinis]WEV49599.1 acyltransferase [Acinetobacter sp. ESL0695]
MAKLNAAESIRGLACLAVVFSHLSLSFYPYLHRFSPEDHARGSWDYAIHHSPFAFWYSGTAAVFVFFVLSGFVLSYAILKNANVPRKVLEMTIKRYPRLAIPAFFSCILAWIALSSTDINSDLVNSWLQSYATETITFKQAVYEGSIGAFFFANSTTNWVLWTMQIELIGSLVLFILLVTYHYKKSLFFIASIFLPCITLGMGESFFLGICSFVIGCYFYLYAKKVSFPVGIVLLVVGLYFAGSHNTSHAYHWLYKILGERTYEYGNFISGMLIVYSILMTPQIGDALDKRPLVYLGKLSFSIYLLHMMLIYLTCIPVFNYLRHLHWGYNISALCAVLVCLFAIVCCSMLYSRYVDDFSVKCSNYLSKKLLGTSK